MTDVYIIVVSMIAGAFTGSFIAILMWIWMNK